MAYVPGYDWDIFISYAHQSNHAPEGSKQRGWVTRFHLELFNNLTKKLELEPAIWIDNSDLRKAGAYPEDLESNVKRSAILLTVNSAAYLHQAFCAWEISQFRTQFGADPRTSSRGRRIVEIYQSRLPNDAFPKIQTDTDSFSFCGAKDKPEETYEPGKAAYTRALQAVSRELEKLLHEMRREAETVFLSPPEGFANAHYETARLYARLRSQLEQDFVVVPSPSDQRHDTLAAASISVHFLDVLTSELNVERIRLAKEGSKPCLVIVGPGLVPKERAAREARGGDVSMFEYRDRLIDEAKRRPGLLIANWIPGQQQLGDLIKWIKGNIRATQPRETARRNRVVYLIYHPEDSGEESVEWLREELKDSEFNNKVIVPPAPEEAEAIVYHTKNIQDCDGVMLVWGHAQKDWFDVTYKKLQKAAGIREGRAFISQARCLIKPDQDEKNRFAEPGVIHLIESLDRERLGDFLLPLRLQAGHVASGD